MGDFNEADYLVGPSSEWYPDRYPCWNDECTGLATFLQNIDVDALRRLSVRDLNPQEAFLALNKMGMPEERDCTAAAVQLVFKESPVKHVNARQLQDSHRSVVDHIELDNGVKVYLAASPDGAIVYRISKPHSYTHANEQAHTPP